MARGRKKLPRNLKLIRGTLQKCRDNPNEPVIAPTSDVPDPPPNLPPLAKECWVELAPTLHGMGVLTPLDLWAFETLCCTYANWRQAKADVDQFGISYTNAKGQLRKHPAVTMMNSSERNLTAWLSEFGMTPAARKGLRMPMPGQEGDNPWSKF